MMCLKKLLVFIALFFSPSKIVFGDADGEDEDDPKIVFAEFLVDI